ncbi:hypothetical protein [Actinomadura xylanilytica]|uniref:hypothetical protein n=1 Tax=Actinomadura xylanilytica TaxID=887459 RepID=UPI00255AE084|nr:hypothetical protein [Actinomadura xylanilytica]MDL4770732.1 hypothetical protein [Actinomadura xylanilytica]
MNDHIAYVTRQLQTADSLPAMITATLVGLELIERAILLLTQIAPDESYPAYATALAEATDAWWAFSQAPSVSYPDGADPPAGDDHREFARRVDELVTAVTRALLGTVNKVTDPADRIACLAAAQHVGHVHTALS